jgi:hypothetical protein
MTQSRITKFCSGSGACLIGRALWTLALISVGGCNRPETVVDRSPGPAEVQYGTRITFGKGGNSESYKFAGWSKTEEKFTWSEGTSAELRIPVPITDESVVLKMKIAALIKPPELPFQPAEVYVNDQKIAEWQTGDPSEFVAAIPHDITKLGGVLAILIKTPKATSPKALGLNADPRVLGICCFELELSKG